MRCRIGRRTVGVVIVLLMIGCSDESKSERQTYVSAPASAPRSPATSPPSGNAGGDDETSRATKSATAGRKIIYNAHVDLVTEDLAALDQKLSCLIETSKGYVADSDLSGSAGSTRHGTWKVRVPVESYDAFLKGVTSLGELVSQKADSQDVSEEYFDLEARQTNKKVEEARLLKHLTDSTGKLDEILTVERELSRVRGEIERMQGRLRALANLTTLTTVTITAREIKGYVPPQAPTFSTRVARTFTASLDSLRLMGESFVLFVVGLVPWVPVIAVGLGIAIVMFRKRPRRVG